MISPFAARLFGTVTLVYVFCATCCSGLAIGGYAAGMDLSSTSADMVVLVAATILYLAGLVPAGLGLAASESTLAAHVVWALLVLGVEVLSTGIFWFTHPGEFWASVVFSFFLFWTWPIACLVVLPLCRRAPPAG